MVIQKNVKNIKPTIKNIFQKFIKQKPHFFQIRKRYIAKNANQVWEIYSMMSYNCYKMHVDLDSM